MSEPTERDRSSKRKSSHRRRLSISLGFSKREKNDEKSSGEGGSSSSGDGLAPSMVTTPDTASDPAEDTEEEETEQDNLPSGVRRVPLLLIVRLIDLTGLPFQEEARYQITWRRGAKRENSGKTSKKPSALGQANIDETLRFFSVAKQVTATGAFLEKSIAFILKRESSSGGVRKSTTAGSIVFDMAPVLRKEVGSSRSTDPHVVTAIFTTTNNREIKMRFEVSAIEDCSREAPTRRAERSRSRTRSRSISRRLRSSFSLSRADQKTLEERIAASTIYEEDEPSEEEPLDATGTDTPDPDDTLSEEVPFTTDDLSSLMTISRTKERSQGKADKRPVPMAFSDVSLSHNPSAIQVYCPEDVLTAQEIEERRLHIISMKDFQFTDVDNELHLAQLEDEARAARARMWEAQMEAKNDEILAAEARLCRAQVKLVQHDQKILGQLQDAYQRLDDQAQQINEDKKKIRDLQDELTATTQRATRFQQARAALEMECQEWQDKANDTFSAMIRFAQEGIVPEGHESYFSESQIAHSDKMRGLLRQGERSVLSESESLRASLLAKEKEAQQAQKQAQESTLELETTTALLVAARTSADEAAQEAQKKEEETQTHIKQLQQTLTEHTELIQQLQEEKANSEAALAQEKQDRAVLAQEKQEALHSIKSLEQQLHELQERQQNTQETLQSTQSASHLLTVQLTSLTEEHEELRRQWTEERTKNEQGEKEKQRLRQELSLHVMAAESIQGDLHQSQTREQLQKAEITELRALYEATNKEAQSRQAQYQQLQVQQASSEETRAQLETEQQQAIERTRELEELVATLQEDSRTHQAQHQHTLLQLAREEKANQQATQQAAQQTEAMTTLEKQVAALQAELSASRRREEEVQATRQREQQQAQQQQQALRDKLTQQEEREKELASEILILSSHQEDQSSETHKLSQQLQRYRDALAQERARQEEHAARMALVEQQNEEQGRHLTRLRALVKELAHSSQPLVTMQAAQYAEDPEMGEALQALAFTYDESLQRNRQQAHLLHSASRNQEEALTSLWAQVESQIDALEHTLYPHQASEEPDDSQAELDRSVEALQRKMNRLVSLVGLVAPPVPQNSDARDVASDEQLLSPRTMTSSVKPSEEDFDALPSSGHVLSYTQVTEKLSRSRMDRLANQTVVTHILNASFTTHAGEHAKHLSDSLHDMPTPWWFQRQWVRTVEALEWAVDHSMYNLQGLIFYLSLATHTLHLLQQHPPPAYQSHPHTRPVSVAGVQQWPPSPDRNEEDQLMQVIVQIFHRIQDHIEEHIDFTAKPAVFGQPVLRKTQYRIDSWSNPITLDRLVVPLETLYRMSVPSGLFPVVCQQLFSVVYGHLSAVLFNELLGRAVLCTPDVAIQIKASLSFIYALEPSVESAYTQAYQRAQEKLHPLEDAANLILTIGHETAFASFEEISRCFVHLNVAQMKHFVDMMDTNVKECAVPSRVRDMIDTKSASPRTQLGTLALYLPLRSPVPIVNN